MPNKKPISAPMSAPLPGMGMATKIIMNTGPYFVTLASCLSLVE